MAEAAFGRFVGANLVFALLGLGEHKADFCSCKICISAIPGGRSPLHNHNAPGRRHKKFTEFSAAKLRKMARECEIAAVFAARSLPALGNLAA
jgi:hypothetical protein